MCEEIGAYINELIGDYYVHSVGARDLLERGLVENVQFSLQREDKCSVFISFFSAAMG